MFFTSNENVGQVGSVSYTPEAGISLRMARTNSLIMSFARSISLAQSSVAKGTAQKTVSSACGTPASKGVGLSSSRPASDTCSANSDKNTAPFTVRCTRTLRRS